MKKIWLPLLIVSILISAFCIFYVAVGASSSAEKNKTVPEEVLKEQRARDEENAYRAKRLVMPAGTYGKGECFTVGAPEYGAEGMFEMDYTVEKAYLSDTLPEGTDIGEFAQFGAFSDGKLQEGYTFLCVDVILKNRDTEKQMYMVNSATVEGAEMYELRGFLGQKFKNTARLHIELFPGDVFETTLFYAVKKDETEDLRLYINNFGYSSPNGTCAYVYMGSEA